MINPSSLDLTTLPSLCLSRRAELPETPAIYFAIDSLGVVQYIGQSTNLRNRWLNHHCQGYVANGGRITYLEVSEVTLLSGIEKALIQWFQPPLNRMINPLVVHSVTQGTIETEDGKVFELESPAGLAWLKSATSFRFVPSGANKPFTVRQETKKGGDYWYGYRKVAGKLHKKYIGKSSELSIAKLEEIAEALNTPQQPRVTQVTEIVIQVTQTNSQRVTDSVTDSHIIERVTALEMQMQALRESLEELRSALLEKA
jgi:hypothetical protein